MQVSEDKGALVLRRTLVLDAGTTPAQDAATLRAVLEPLSEIRSRTVALMRDEKKVE